MARENGKVRPIDPSIWTNEAFISCSPLARLVWLSLHNFSDNCGVFEWRLTWIRIHCLPGDNCNIDNLMAELVASDIVIKFEHDGAAYGIIRGFGEWQRFRNPDGRFPLPDHLVEAAGWGPAKPYSWLPTQIRADVLAAADGRCVYCGITLTIDDPTANDAFNVDHVHPRVRGGSDDIGNLAASCRRCNLSKGAKTLDEWTPPNRMTDGMTMQ